MNILEYSHMKYYIAMNKNKPLLLIVGWMNFTKVMLLKPYLKEYILYDSINIIFKTRNLWYLKSDSWLHLKWEKNGWLAWGTSRYFWDTSNISFLNLSACCIYFVKILQLVWFWFEHFSPCLSLIRNLLKK